MTKRNKYTAKQLEFLRTGYLSMPVGDLAKAFSLRFGIEKTEGQIKATLKNHRIRCGRAHKDRFINRIRLFTLEQIQFLKDNYPGRNVVELKTLFNAIFNTTMTRQQIKTAVHNRGIISGRIGCFEKGHKPWNYGTKGLTSANRTSFKKGNVPANRKPLWDERVCPRNGFILMKVPETDPYTGFPTRYKHKHVWIWEQINGPVPEGMVVAFWDGEKTNCDPDNLMLISRAENLNLNRLRYRETPNDVKPSILALSKMQIKMWEVQNGL